MARVCRQVCYNKCDSCKLVLKADASQSARDLMNMKTQLAILVTSLTCAALVSSEPLEEKPIWHTDWPSAQRLARQANKPIFAVLTCQH